MAISIEGVRRFTVHVVNLQSFPLFCAYLLMVFLSPLWQRISKPLSIRPVLVLYNFACSFISVYTLFGFIYCLYLSPSIFAKEEMPALKPIYYLYWLTKNLELLDTVFMIIRHKNRQISFLHVYHHASMLLLSCYAYYYSAWPAIVFYLALNAFVHVVLYFYYGLTALFPTNPPQWKKQLTQLQIGQFFMDFIYAGVGYAYHGFCIYGPFYGITMTALFTNFYYHAYVRPRSKGRVHTNNNLKSD